MEPIRVEEIPCSGAKIPCSGQQNSLFLWPQGIWVQAFDLFYRFDTKTPKRAESGKIPCSQGRQTLFTMIASQPAVGYQGSPAVLVFPGFRPYVSGS
jgi:hypothetical protein